jgi:hypothetical protein
MQGFPRREEFDEMTAREQLIQEIAQAPDFLVEEVLDFLLFSKQRREQNITVSKPTTPPEQKSKPIWEIFEEFTNTLPEEVISQLPVDGSAQIDHYLYGTPKQE